MHVHNLVRWLVLSLQQVEVVSHMYGIRRKHNFDTYNQDNCLLSMTMTFS